MSLWKIAWRSIQQRGLASALTAVSMALGVMLVVVVLTIHGVVSKSFRSNSTLGYNMIVGARGGSLQLTLNTVYYLSKPVENISYDYYLEFLSPEQRADQMKHSVAYNSMQAERRLSELHAIASASAGPPGLNSLGTFLALDAVTVAAEEELGSNRSGKYAPYCDIVIPLCLGDYFGNYRVIGTTPALFDDFYYDLDNQLKYQIEDGRNFRHFDEKNGYFEAVVGGAVARDMQVNVGDKINPSHGVPGGHVHERNFTVVGILALSGTPNDRAVFVNMEGFYLMEDHALDLAVGEDEEDSEGNGQETSEPKTDSRHDTHDQHHGQKIEPLPVEQRQITSMLVRTANSPIVVPGLVKTINRENIAQAVLPVEEIYGLFNVIVRPIQNALLLLTGMICLVSGVSILVSIYNSMSDRRHEIAVMRALGAGRGTVMSVILFESVILSLGGGLIGWFAAHTMNAIASPWVESQTGVSIGFWSLAPKENILAMISYEMEWMIYPELLLIPALILLAITVGFLPAMAAYRTDVAKSLGK